MSKHRDPSKRRERPPTWKRLRGARTSSAGDPPGENPPAGEAPERCGDGRHSHSSADADIHIQDLQERERRYRTIVEAADDLIFIIDRSDRVVYVNAAAAASQHRKPEELIGRKRSELFPSQVARSQRASLRSVVASGEPAIFESELAVRGGRIWIHTRLVPLRNEKGRVHAVLGISRDITMRRRAELALAASEQRYRTLVETSPDGIAMIDLDGRVQMANHRAAQVSGYARPEELIGRHMSELVVPEQRGRAEREFIETVAAGRVRSREYSLLRPDGTTLTGEVNASVIAGPDGEPVSVIAVLRDITERKQLQHRLFEAQKLETIATLVAGVCHDFGNVLAAVLGNVSMLQRRSSLSERDRELLAETAVAAERGSAYVRQLLSYRKNAPRLRKSLDVNTLIRSSGRLVCSIEPRAQISFKLARRLPPVLGDATQLEQVFTNLLLNAAQASESPSKVSVTTAGILLQSEQAAGLELKPGRYVIVGIQDQGCGMDERTRARAFEPFFTTKPSGRGMGLPACLGIARSHDGQLRIESKPGHGTIARLWLPAGQARSRRRSGRPAAFDTPPANR
ncbi:MAG: hypothetical protein AMXMBFR13_32270 [Phycisphaerae bacterium]